MTVTLVEIKGYDVVEETEKTLYFSDLPIVPFPPSDADRGNIFYSDKLQDIGSYQRSMFAKSRTRGSTTANAGTVTIDNNDGEFDYLHNWSFSGRIVVAYRGNEGDSFNRFVKILETTIRQLIFNFDLKTPSTIEFTLIDKDALFEQKISQSVYAGTNIGAVGDEGLETDLKAKPKPLGFGKIMNASPRLVNASAHRYQVHDGRINAITEVYDRRVPLVYNEAPTIGEYSVDLESGIITLGSKPSGHITVDFEGYSDDHYPTSVGDIILQIATVFGGLNVDDVHTESFDQLNSVNSSDVGIYVKEDSTVKGVLTPLCESIGAYYVFDQTGRLKVGRIEQPKPSPDHTVDDNDLLGISRVQSSDDDKGVPTFSVSLDYQKNYTLQDIDDLAGSVQEQDSAFTHYEYRSTVSQDLSIKSTHLLSPEIKITTLLVNELDAEEEADRLLQLYKVRRYFYVLTLPLIDQFDLVDLGDTLEITLDRMGMGEGKNFLIVGIDKFSPTINSLQLWVWG